MLRRWNPICSRNFMICIEVFFCLNTAALKSEINLLCLHSIGKCYLFLKWFLYSILKSISNVCEYILFCNYRVRNLLYIFDILVRLSVSFQQSYFHYCLTLLHILEIKLWVYSICQVKSVLWLFRFQSWYYIYITACMVRFAKRSIVHQMFPKDTICNLTL